MKTICVTFWLFGFDIRVYADLKAEEVLDTVNKLAKEDLKNYNSLVVFVLSHGGLVTVSGHNGVQVNINQLQWPFRAQNCPDLQDKPKIFFIQQGGHPSRVGQSIN